MSCYRRIARSGGVRYCRVCEKTKPDREFYSKSNGNRCKLCWSADMRKKYHEENPEKRQIRNNRLQVWRDNNREWFRFQHVLHAYGLTLDQYYALEESQDFVCAICGEECELHVDHNHITNKVRGLLCKGCNMGLGNFKDSDEKISKAVDYLRRKGTYAHDFDRHKDVGYYQPLSVIEARRARGSLSGS